VEALWIIIDNNCYASIKSQKFPCFFPTMCAAEELGLSLNWCTFGKLWTTLRTWTNRHQN